MQCICHFIRTLYMGLLFVLSHMNVFSHHTGVVFTIYIMLPPPPFFYHTCILSHSCFFNCTRILFFIKHHTRAFLIMPYVTLKLFLYHTCFFLSYIFLFYHTLFYHYILCVFFYHLCVVFFVCFFLHVSRLRFFIIRAFVCLFVFYHTQTSFIIQKLFINSTQVYYLVPSLRDVALISETVPCTFTEIA